MEVPMLRSLLTLFIIVVSGLVMTVAHPKQISKIPESLQNMTNVRLPVPGRISAGPPTAEQLVAFAAAGGDIVINLQSFEELQDIPEASWAAKANLDYFHIPIAGSNDLTREAVAQFDQIVTANRDRQMLMHCGSGNRVGAMIALRAAWHQGATAAEAIALGEEYGLASLKPHVESLLKE
ncbi:serine/threonine protein phosphatase [Pseudidiomarina aestuarii]|uniref:Serine/threonine protein phosphatase n=2 Tax=Pseudidiomarina aestuarii TaxID=624146 RepID=A0A7Z6ZSF4_9GAMM|nr:serine/threonine protein phosphatase [Pseudidiomarina aestuarii]